MQSFNVHYENVVDGCGEFPTRVRNLLKSRRYSSVAGLNVGWILIIQMSHSCRLETQIRHIEEVGFDYVFFYDPGLLDESSFPVSMDQVYDLRVRSQTERLSVSFVSFTDAKLLQKITAMNDL